FEVYRKISFNNDYTNEYILVVEGLCSMDVNDAETAFNVICKVGPNEYLRHTQVLSTFTSATVEQLKTSNVSAYHYRMTYKPQAIL
ncbi:beta-sandwich lipoprotein, partial [Enterococcus faecalis]|uniref:beta-sandwich lipoprotein n=1 Tax=Enterococcus faecalis TaxID=1351 RepID=UPI00403F3E6B